jgi:periplasmic protein CpxP/Spy
MSQPNFQFASSAARAATAVAIAAMITFAAAPVLAATDPEQPRIEARIKDMHAKLKITAAEEEQWAKVTDVMRDNANKMDEMNNARLANAKSMNAMDDLKSYGDVVDAHADEIKKFAVAFSPLYASMSDAQKAVADQLFRHGDAPQKVTQKK